jgi:hypothetical protein
MHVPLLEEITKDLLQRSVAVLRFNFRGVGRSTGVHDDGIGEIDDVAAAIDHAGTKFPELQFGVAGSGRTGVGVSRNRRHYTQRPARSSSATGTNSSLRNW